MKPEAWQPQRIEISQVELRAVPCAEHGTYTTGCPNCLTGAEAQARGVPQETKDCGVVAYWDRNPIRRLAWRLRHPKSGTVTTTIQEV